MSHLSAEQLQLLLAGELDPLDAVTVQDHLGGCSQCESLLAMVAADDALLTNALALTPEESEWMEAQDLRTAVMRRLRPWFLQPQGLIVLLPLVTAAGWMLQQVMAEFGRALPWEGPVGFTLAVLETTARITWTFLNYIGSGGPLAVLLPLLIIGTTVWMTRRKNQHA